MYEITKNEQLIEDRIFLIRNQRVMIDRDLAELYGVKTYRLNEAVKRNIKRFPEDFMFKLNDKELKELIANCDRFMSLKHSSSLPKVFKEQGVAMLATVLNSDIAIAINIKIMRAFVKLRQYAISQNSKSKEIEELKTMLMLHIENTDNRLSKDEKTISQIIDALNNLIENPQEHKQIGFRIDNK